MGMVLYFVKKDRDNASGRETLISEKIEEATTMLSELSRGRRDLMALEKRLLEREKAVSALLLKAQMPLAAEMPQDYPGSFSKSAIDPYKRASEFLKGGVMNEDINGLGLLKGELELISALNNVKQ
ncbi:MAG: hypothetical protein AABZ23_00895 [Deltaproteobacteria bacterium]